MVQAFIQGRKTRFWVAVDANDEKDEQDFDANEFHASFMAAIQAASRWRSLVLRSFPPPGEYKKVHTILQPLDSLWSFRMSEDCDLGDLFEPLMTAIATTAPPHLTDLDLSDLNSVLYLTRPACLHVFCSLTTLTITLSKKMEEPADILPHLQRLEEFDARHLHLPIYSPNACLPLIQTLHSLTLKSVSVQWMAGRVFPVLWRCHITFPHHADTICIEPVTMPACASLKYDSNDLDPLRYFRTLPIDELVVASGQWNTRRGNRQLITISPRVVASAQSLIVLDIRVQCCEQLLLLLLGVLQALEQLVLRLASPHALSATFFQAFIAAESDAHSTSEMPALPRLPLAMGLIELRLDYQRWLRGSERKTLIPVFGDILSSRQQSGLSINITFNGAEDFWTVGRPIERMLQGAPYSGEFILGISSPRGIIPLDMIDVFPSVPFKEAEYLVAGHQLSIDHLLTLHHLVELRIKADQDALPTVPPPKLPLFDSLKVLEANNLHPWFLAGQTFHRLEKCRISLCGERHGLGEGQVIRMPVCERVDVDDLNLLAILKLPRIRELRASFHHPEFDMIWEKHIAVNANLSGLELLHVDGWNQQAELIEALGFLPVLKSLILENRSDLDAGFFQEFVPKHLLMQPHNEHQISILCPTLRTLLIQGFDLTKKRELVPVFKEVVILRAVCGSPLTTFTLLNFSFAPGSKIELIGGHGGFVVEKVVLGENDKPFRLEI